MFYNVNISEYLYEYYIRILGVVGVNDEVEKIVVREMEWKYFILFRRRG